MLHRLVLAAILAAFMLFSSPPKYTSLKETMYFSRVCPQGQNWYMLNIDSTSATFECDYDDDTEK